MKDSSDFLRYNVASGIIEHHGEAKLTVIPGEDIHVIRYDTAN